MPLALRIEEHGGPEASRATDVTVPAPGPGEVHIRHTAVGVNFIDIYHRSGLYPLDLPSGLGLEAAGEVVASGEGVTGLQAGDRVAYAGGPPGAYAEERLYPADRLVRLPDDIPDEAAAALMLKGMTAWYLLCRTFPVTAGHTLLVHAAAGGVGSLLVPWARHLGATVIGTAGGESKCERARSLGCDHVIDYRERDVPAAVAEITGGRGVDVVYDSVGRDTFRGSLDCLRHRGMLVCFGNASGAPPAIEPNELAAKGSLFLTRPTLFHYIEDRAELETAAAAVFELVRAGVIEPGVNQRYALKHAADAHRDLAARRSVGSSVLVP